MKLSCRQNVLLNAVNNGMKAVTSKTTMPILECFLIEAYDSTIKITSNNMELGIETTIEGRVDEGGKIAVNAKMLSDILHKLPDETVHIEVDDKFYAFLKCGKFKCSIPGLSGEDYPEIQKIGKENPVRISQYSLKQVIGQTLFAVSDNETTKTMTGEHFEVNENELTISALDGHRVAIRKILLKENHDKVDVIIPGRTLGEISKIIEGDTEKDVEISISSNLILFETGNTIITSRLIEGNFVDINRVLNYDFDTVIKIDKKQLREDLDRSTLFVKESEKKPLIFDIEDNTLKLSMTTSIGSMVDEIDIEKNGDDLKIGFNPKFFLDVIRVIDDDEISLYFTKSKAPCFIKDDEVNPSYNYVIMPVNVI